MTVVDGVRLVSNSEIQTFKDCPRKWWLAWHRGLKPKTQSVIGPRSTGTRLHVALAALYRPNGTLTDMWGALADVHAEDLQRLDAQVVEAQFGDNLTGGTDELHKKLSSDFDLESAMIEGYAQWLEETGIDSQLEVISAEQKVEAPFTELRGVPVHLIAKIDARVRNAMTGAVKFIDHKSVGTLVDTTLGINQQMLHYHVIEDLAAAPGEPRCEGALYNMLRKIKRTRGSKPPYYGRIPIDHNKFELEGYRNQLIGTIGRIAATEEALAGHVPHQVAVPSRPSRDCTWKCDFFKICRMFDDGSRVDAAIEDHYVVGDPLSHYTDKETDESSN
jgi:PD-(D/E)XK nuclease superfamily